MITCLVTWNEASFYYRFFSTGAGLSVNFMAVRSIDDARKLKGGTNDSLWRRSADDASSQCRGVSNVLANF